MRWILPTWMAVLVVACGTQTAPTEPSLPEPVAETVERIIDRLPHPDPDDLALIGASGDSRLAWLLVDFLQFHVVGDSVRAAQQSLSALARIEISSPLDWITAADHLIAEDVPAYPGYVAHKRAIFASVDERWAPFFDESGPIDYRLWAWGSVFIDDRPPDDAGDCHGCIPALDHPQSTVDGDWYPADGVVLGVTIGGEARAYPLHIMQVHEMVNDRLGGREFALPFCTLCGTAQLYFTDGIDPRPYLRTSGLLARSNKVSFDVVTGSVFDTFTGFALIGPLAGSQLEMGTVITTTWGEWRATHPDTTIVELTDGAGRSYSFDPLSDRDAAGPIFPTGPRDPRLPAHESVVGVIRPDGTPVAFVASVARLTLAAGEPVTQGGVEVVEEAGGLVARVGGNPVPSHQSYWFAWSQFHPGTLLWVGE